jgi:PHD-finger
LGLCSVFIDEWRGRARSFLIREDVQYVVRGGHLTEKSTESALNHTSQLSQCDNGAAPSSSLGGLEREALLLQECLQLYFEPRLLRIKPAETLDLRALAFLISASTVLNPHSHTNIHTHTPGVPSGLQGSLSSVPVEDPNPSKQSQEETSKDLISIRELKKVIEGGNYFLKQLKKEMSKREDVPSNLARTDVIPVSGTYSKSDTVLPTIKSNVPQEEQRSELENLCRERLRDRIYYTVITVSCRLEKCMKMLRVASEYHSKISTRHKNNGNLLFNTVSEADSLQPTVTENILYPMECFQKEESSAVNDADEIFMIDDALETACHGICMKEQYEYVRLKNILLRECKNVPWNVNMNMNVVQDSTLKRLRALGYFQTSTDDIQRWCWCRGVDDGRPMVQCDGCDEWFHSLCMGLCKSSSSSTSQSKSSKKTLQSIKEEGAVKGPLSATCATVPCDDDTVSHKCIRGVQNNAVKQETKRKGKIKVKQEKKSLEEINEKVNSMFFCIACSEEREDDYPFAWTSDNS